MTPTPTEVSSPAPRSRLRFDRFWAALGVIAAGGLALRLWVVFVQRPTVDVSPPGGGGYVLAGDAFYYHWQARLLADGHGFVDSILWFNTGELEPSAGHVPLHSMFLGAVSWVGAQGVTAHRVATSIVGALTVVVIGLVARRLAGNRAGLLAAGIAAIYPQLWINDGMLLSESVTLFMVAVSLLMAYRFWERPTLPNAAILGAALAVTTLGRSEQVALFALIVVPLVWGMRQFDWKAKLRLLAVCGVTGLIVLSPWLAFTLTAFDRPVLLSNGSGAILSAGACDEVFYGEFIGYYANCFQGPFAPPGSDEAERDAAARDYAEEYISNHKGRLPIVVAARVGRVWGVFKPSQTTFLDWWLEGRGHAASVTGAFAFYFLMPFAVGGVVVLKRRRIPISPLVALAIVVTIAAAVSFGVTRYRAPAEVAIVIAAAVGIDALVRYVMARRAAGSSGDGGREPEPEPELVAP